MNTKTKIYLMLLIWGAVVLQIAVNRSVDREEILVEQVLSDGVDNVKQGSVKAFGYYGDEKLSEDTKETIVKRVAKMLGIDDGYTVSESKEDTGLKVSNVTRLAKKGENGDTEIKLISVCENDLQETAKIEQYLLIEIDLKAQATAAVTSVKQELSDIYEDLGMEPSFNMHMTSQKKGKLTEEEMDAEIELYFDELDAKKVSFDTFQNTMIAYGYSKDIDDYVYQGTDKVNVQIAFSYDEKNDVTLMHTAVPFIDGAF